MRLETPDKYVECDRCSALAEAKECVTRILDTLRNSSAIVNCTDLKPNSVSLQTSIKTLSVMQRLVVDSADCRVSDMVDVVPCPGKINLFGGITVR